MTSAKDRQVGGDHYRSLAIQPVEFIQRNSFNYCEAAAIKYICRHRAKNGRQDIEKAIHYLELLLELEYETISQSESPREITVDGDEIPGSPYAACEE